MTNEEKAKQLYRKYRETDFARESAAFNAAMEMAEWKDEQLYLLLDAIDHAYLKTDGTYGDLSYEVSDKVKYLKNIIRK